MPPAMPLAVVIRSGTTPSWSQANQSPVRQKPVCTSSAMSRMPCSRHQSARPGQEALRRHDEAALALDRLDDDGGGVLLADLGVDLVGHRAQRLLGAVLAPPGQR
jgi:hypothetical protein